MTKNKYDAIVVGTGHSGGWAAKELCEKGLKTLVLERGRNIEHITGYTDTTKDPWQLEHHGEITQKDRENSPIQSTMFNEVTKKYFVNDLENPYEQIKPFDWIRGNHVGGRSIMWGRQCYRKSDIDFEANLKDGYGVDWPIRYKDIDPWYDYVEPFIGISGSVENMDVVPDGKFLPPMEMNVVEKAVAARVNKHFEDGRRIIIGRCANHTKRVGDRGPCQYRNKCAEGCPYSGYFSSNSATLPAAAKTGNMTLRPFSIVTEIIYDKEAKKAKGVRIQDTETGEVIEYFAKVIFLCASTFGTTFILLNSISETFPNGFGNGSGQLGHNLMDSQFGFGASGTMEGYENKYTYGRRPNGIYVPRFRNLNEQTKHKDFVRGYGFQGAADRGRPTSSDKIGVFLKEELSEPGNWTMAFGSDGEHLPYFENKVTLNKNKIDKYGLPILSIDCEFKENEIAMRKDMMETAAEMLEVAGAKNIKTFTSDYKPGFYITESGTVRMGHDPKTSVLNKWNQMHEVKNVFVTDASCMTSGCTSPGPSVTYMALTARAVDYAVKEMKKLNL